MQRSRSACVTRKLWPARRCRRQQLSSSYSGTPSAADARRSSTAVWRVAVAAHAEARVLDGLLAPHWPSRRVVEHILRLDRLDTHVSSAAFATRRGWRAPGDRVADVVRNVRGGLVHAGQIGVVDQLTRKLHASGRCRGRRAVRTGHREAQCSHVRPLVGEHARLETVLDEQEDVELPRQLLLHELDAETDGLLLEHWPLQRRLEVCGAPSQ
ncbi:hypothetical protein PybrP1_007448 [[Pythium] brassicae (nom. inval.)]|nr:hypothetical protein PybrP1_007448 [[Pythium] brassicae (nom. inval.)]